MTVSLHIYLSEENSSTSSLYQNLIKLSFSIVFKEVFMTLNLDFILN